MFSTDRASSERNFGSSSNKELANNDYTVHQRNHAHRSSPTDECNFSANHSTQKITELYASGNQFFQQTDSYGRSYPTPHHGDNTENTSLTHNIDPLPANRLFTGPAAGPYPVNNYSAADAIPTAYRAPSDEALIEPFSFSSPSAGSVPGVERMFDDHSLAPSLAYTIAQARKPRREKPHIELAPDQPPTTQGKPRERVYVACVQCRGRKIRCDGAKPTCHNCGQRGAQCTYDSAPKRRGPDKTPGARQRISRTEEESGMGPIRRRRRRRSVTAFRTAENPVNDSGSINPNAWEPQEDISPSSSALVGFHFHESQDVSPGVSHAVPGSFQGADRAVYRNSQDNRSQMSAPTKRKWRRQESESLTLHAPQATRSAQSRVREVDKLEEARRGETISPEPSLNFSRKTWWESLLSLYVHSSPRHLPITSAQSMVASQKILADLRFLFRCSNYWFSFIHVPTFFNHFFDPLKREKIQPSLILAALAVSTFFQSSEIEKGAAGRERALRLREEAQSAFEASFNAGWIDETLVQVAWLLAFFEVCAHTSHSTMRSRSAMLMLDSLIRSMSLTSLDADDPRVSVFTSHDVPVIAKNSPQDKGLTSIQHRNANSLSDVANVHDSAVIGNSAAGGCSCQSLTLGQNWAQTSEIAPLWTATPAWNDHCSEGELRKESCRRIYWSAMILAAGHNAYATANQTDILDLQINDPGNCSLLFSGESLKNSSKDSIWALYDRAIVLWNSCVRMRGKTDASDAEKSQFGLAAWLEADDLELALKKHTCGLERAFMFLGREHLFNTRMVISHEFRRYIPLVTANVSGLFHRFKAGEWLSRQAMIAENLMMGLHTVTGHSTNILAHRPFFVFWLMGQASRSLFLWECDRTLLIALGVCKAYLHPIEYLTALWPCEAFPFKEQRQRYDRLRSQISSACHVAGVSPPPPPNMTLPDPSQPGQVL